MQIFALQTDIEKIRKRFIDSEDEHVLLVHYHPLRFFLATAREIGIGILFILLAVFVYENTPITLGWTLWTTTILLLVFVIIPMIRDYIDWRYDFIEITKDKVIIVDQTFIFKQRIKQINMENFASVEAETQLMNIFPLGRVRFSLKEGTGEEIMVSYIPHAAEVADTIADTVSGFQRRREFKQSESATPQSVTPMP